MADEVKGRFLVLEQSAAWRGLARALMALVPIMLFGYFAQHITAGVFGFHLLAIALLLHRWQRRQNFAAVPRERDVKITPDGVWLDGALALPRERIADGQFQPRALRQSGKFKAIASTVRLFDARKGIVFEVEVDESAAQQMLGVLGLDPLHRRASFDAVSPLFGSQGRTYLFLAATMALSFTIGAVLHLNLAPFIALPIFLAGMWPTRVEVGIDGVLVRWLWQKRFIPMSEIRDAYELDGRSLGILLTSGEAVTVHTGMTRNRGTEPAEKRDAIVARIREAKAARSEATRVDVAALVSRGSREHADWVKAVKDLRVPSGYRTTVVRDEDLWTLVEDASAPEDARAGAALALRSSLDEEGKGRVRIAAEATVSPKLRVALEAAAGESDEEAHQALVQVGRA